MEQSSEKDENGTKVDVKNDESNNSDASDSLNRNSFTVDDFPDFDPDGLEVEDDWRDVFDDEDDSSPLDAAATTSLDDNDSKPPGDDSATDSINSSTLMPPPPSLTASSSKGTPSTSTTKLTTPSKMPTTFSTIPGIEGLVTNRPPLDHSITRRKKTAGTVDRRDSAPPSWHSEAADLPHRQAMVQDIAKLLYARKKGKNPSRSWLERVPLKAKTLENQLYKNAASLEAYLNRSTLKVRLGKLASAITSHYKQATKSRRGSTRSSSSSISSLASLENAFADAKLRRESVSSIQSLSSVQSLPSSLNGRSNQNLNLGKNNEIHNNGSNVGGALKFAPQMRRQSDSILNSRNSAKSPPSHTSISGAVKNNSTQDVMQKGNSSTFHAANVSGSTNGDGMTAGMQQQLLANLRQQQQNLNGRVSSNGSTGAGINASQAGSNQNMTMMGVGGNFPMLNQQAMMQQQNAMNMSLLQQQQNMFLQQQQSQSANQPGLSLHNISIMQQQQQRQMQQQQHPMMSMAGGQMNGNAMGMNMMNPNLSMVIPGMNASRNPQMQTMLNSQLGMGGNVGMSNNNMMDMMNMPPPGMAGAAAVFNARQRQNSTGNNNANNDEPNSPLSPGSFNW